MTKLINCMPHDVTILTAGGPIVLPPSGTLPRCAEEHTPLQALSVDGIGVNVVKVSYGDITDLPEQVDDTYHIVSLLVAQAAPHRDDLLSPAQTVRGDGGQIVGCKVLARPYTK